MNKLLNSIPTAITVNLPSYTGSRPSIQEFQCLKWTNDGQKESIRIMHEVTSRWRDFGVALGFSVNELDVIEMGCLREPRDCIQKLFGEWAMSKDTYSWDGLVEALQDAGFSDLATRVGKAVASMQ